jgi:hypothetical protein
MAAVLLPTDERERFEQLLRAAREAVRKVRGPIADSIPFHLGGGAMPLPDNDQWARDEALAEADSGKLTKSGERGGFVPNTGYKEVRVAVEAAEAIQEFFQHESSRDFDEWFADEFGVPADLSQPAAFSALLVPRTPF